MNTRQLINPIYTTRPETLDDIIGMEFNKQIILYDIVGSQKLEQNLPSFIIAGPPGTGKTTLAECISKLSKRPDGSQAEIHKMLGSDIKDPQDIYDLAAKCEDGDIIYLEEAHTLGGNKSRFCQAILLEWLEHFKILGGAAMGMVEAPKTCFLLPTTNPGKLHPALRSRCKTLYTQYYSLNEMKAILYNAGLKFGLSLDEDDTALTLLAQSSRGTPRTAIMHRLDILRKVIAVDNEPYNANTVRKALDVNGVNYWGLEQADLNYLRILHHKMQENNNRPVSRRIMAQSTGFSDDMMDNIIESYLLRIDAISIISQGRIITPFGASLINESILPVNSTTELINDTLSSHDEELMDLLQNEDLCRQGMRPFMVKLNLRYGPDNKLFQQKLASLGYVAKQRAGIVKIVK